MERRYFKGDKWTRGYGSVVPTGAEVQVLRFFPRRKALVDWQGTRVITMVWCLSKRPVAGTNCTH